MRVRVLRDHISTMAPPRGKEHDHVTDDDDEIMDLS
jgi:hypothetical protein